jgi:hypothetical protein
LFRWLCKPLEDDLYKHIYIHIHIHIHIYITSTSLFTFTYEYTNPPSLDLSINVSVAILRKLSEMTKRIAPIGLQAQVNKPLFAFLYISHLHSPGECWLEFTHYPK